MLNNKVPWLTRQLVYAFLAGLILGGVVVGLLDYYAKKPMYSDAFMSASQGGLPYECDSFNSDTAKCWRSSFFQSWWGDLWGGMSWGGSTGQSKDGEPKSGESQDLECYNSDGEWNYRCEDSNQQDSGGSPANPSSQGSGSTSTSEPPNDPTCKKWRYFTGGTNGWICEQR